MTKPFVLLQSRPEDEASDNEYQAFLHFGGLTPTDLERVRIEAGQRPAQSLAAYSEAIGAVPITLTPAARDDSLLADLPTTFDGFVGHKEGVLEPPAACTVLARSRRCVQMLRVGRNV